MDRKFDPVWEAWYRNEPRMRQCPAVIHSFSTLMFWSKTCDVYRMILLIWSSERAPECAQLIERTLDQPVRVVPNLEQACEELKSGAFSAVLLDQWIYENSTAKADFVFQHLGSAAPVIVNFAISAIDRVVRMLRTSLEQRRREIQLARRQACLALNAELKDELTALALCCGAFLQDPTLTAHALEQIKRIQSIGHEINQKLRSEEQSEAMVAAHA